MSNMINGSQPVQNWNPSLGSTETASVITALGQLEQQLPFLLGLGREQRKRYVKVGPATRPFITDALKTAEANPGLVPRSVDLATMRSRADTLMHLAEVKRALTQVLEKVDDTEVVLASEVYAVARTVYSVMKTPATLPGLKENQSKLAQRFSRKTKRSPNEPAQMGPAN